MSSRDEIDTVFHDLRPGDRVKVVHEVKVGMKRWETASEGEVVETRRRRHGLHFRRNGDDKVYSDEILMRREDGELTTVTLDEFSRLEKIA
ncbi:MAG: hypothetical protein N2C14_25940 [Planctomycetales bacterium]